MQLPTKKIREQIESIKTEMCVKDAAITDAERRAKRLSDEWFDLARQLRAMQVQLAGGDSE